MESRRYISLALWAKERRDRLDAESANLVSLPVLVEPVDESAPDFAEHLPAFELSDEAA